MPRRKWIIEQNSMLIYFSVGPAGRPSSLETVQSQRAAAHLQKGFLAPSQPLRPSLGGGSHPHEGPRDWRTGPLNLPVFPSLVQIVFPRASFCLGAGSEDVKAQSGFVAEEGSAALEGGVRPCVNK